MAMLKKFINKIGVFFSYAFPYKLSVGLKLVKNTIYSGYVQRQFKSVGKNFSIEASLRGYGFKYMQIGDNFVALSGLWLDAYDRFADDVYTPDITIGNNVNFGTDCHLGCINRLVIGNGVLLASKVYITDHFHGDTNADSLLQPPVMRPLVSKGPVVIEDNVWVGESVVIMPGVTIGKNSIVGANAVVTKSFGPNSVIAGAPAKLIKTIQL